MLELVEKHWMLKEAPNPKQLYVLNDGSQFEYKHPVTDRATGEEVFYELNGKRTRCVQHVRVPPNVERTLVEAFELEQKRLEVQEEEETAPVMVGKRK